MKQTAAQGASSELCALMSADSEELRWYQGPGWRYGGDTFSLHVLNRDVLKRLAAGLLAGQSTVRCSIYYTLTLLSNIHHIIGSLDYLY